MSTAYIVAAARTAGGRKGGRLSGWHPADLAGKLLDALVERTHADPALIEDVIMGCVSQVGEQAGNVARNAVLSSKLPESVPGTSVDRQCGSSQQAVHFAAQAVMSGTMDVVIAAGVESMSRVPMGLSVALPAKNGFGKPSGAAMSARYPGVEFSQFIGAEMMAVKYGLSKDSPGPVRVRIAPARDRSDARRSLREGNRVAGNHVARRLEGSPSHRRRHSLRCEPGSDPRREAAQGRRPHHRGDLEPDLRRRLRRHDREREGPQGARRRSRWRAFIT